MAQKSTAKSVASGRKKGERAQKKWCVCGVKYGVAD